jgi:cephalosporin hydroxylase
MKTINDYYLIYSQQPSDINEHLSVLKEYASNNIVTEFGVRHGISTIALLHGNPAKLTSWDIKYTSEIDVIKNMCLLENKNFIFNKGDTKECTIDDTDVLFIDTLHTYDQLIAELIKHHNKVKKYIILHDTSSYEFNDEMLFGYSPSITKKSGLWPAIEEFLNTNKNWIIKKRYTNNNGLTILEKIS